MKNTLTIPNVPVISRYSAPWDADCWYYARADLKKGSMVSSNFYQAIKKIKSKYIGCEYIVTYDSKLSKKIDHQENDFYVERNCDIYVCIDKEAVIKNELPLWLLPWEKTGDEVETNICTYVLFKKTFASGTHVVIPAFEGEYHNYFVLALPTEKDGKKEQVKRGIISKQSLWKLYSMYI